LSRMLTGVFPRILTGSEFASLLDSGVQNPVASSSCFLT
jgi:hypothetical protein